MGDDSERRVVGTLRQAQKGCADFACRVQLWPSKIKPPKTKKDRNKLWSLTHLPTQRVCLGVGLLHLGRCLPFGHEQRCTEGEVQGHGVPGPLGRLWQGFEQRDPRGQVADGFEMGRTVAGLLAGPLPVAERLLCAARGGVVLGHQFRLRLD